MNQFKWIAILFFAPTLLISPIVNAQSTTASAANGPKIYCAYPKFDFHTVNEGPDITHLFHFKNVGKSTLVISSVHTSCGCTAAVVNTKQIRPGGYGVIKATYHTHDRPGHATKIITITSNDSVNPSYQMQLDMTVVQEVSVEPQRAYFYGLKHNTSQTNEINIFGKPHKYLNVLSAQDVGGKVTVSFKPYVDKAGFRYGDTLTVTAPATLPIGEFSDTINVTTDDPLKPTLTIPVQGEVVGRVQYSPKTLYFAAGQQQPSYVQFTVSPPQGFAIRDVSSLKHLIRPDVQKTIGSDGNDSYSIEVYCVQNLPANSDGHDELDITTNDPEQPRIVIPVTLAKK
ncbi:MAG: DUF1573 domain-containing protein [bacterium]